MIRTKSRNKVPSAKSRARGIGSWFFSAEIGCVLAPGVTLRRALWAVILAGLTMTCVGCSALAYLKGQETIPEPGEKGYGSLARFPFKEAWYGVYFQDDKIGYSHFRIEPAGENFKILSDSRWRVRLMNETNEVRTEEQVVVRPDLTLVSFEYNERKDDDVLRMIGHVENERLQVTTSVGGQTRKVELPLPGPVHPTTSLSLIPALKGLKDGKQYTVTVFSPKAHAFATLNQLVTRVHGEPGPNGEAWRVKTFTDKDGNPSWLNETGLTVLEQSFNGGLITMLESESAAKEFAAGESPAKDFASYSLIRVSKPIKDAENTQYLKVAMKGLNGAQLPEDHRQSVTKPENSEKNDEVTIVVRRENADNLRHSGEKPDRESLEQWLRSTAFIESDDELIVETARLVTSGSKSDPERIRKLSSWIAKNVEDKPRDSYSARSVLKSRVGECEAHTKLYTAMARALNIPTRMVRGLVYVKDAGFQYHAWAESYIDGWIAVDPTMDQVPADATHIKISAGTSRGNPASVARMVGKVEIEVLEYR